MAEVLQFTITGISVGMVFALIALGFVVIWKSSGVANLALGQLVLLNSWVAYSILGKAHMPLWAGAPLIIIFAILLGWLIERLVLRPLIAQPILSLIAVTLGLAYFIQGLVIVAWPESLARLPSLFPREPVHIGTAVLSQEYLWAAIISLIIFVCLTLFFKYHRMGIVMRATADDQLAVQACGIPVTKIFSMSWILACILAAVGGILMSSISGITFGLVNTGLQSFSVVILGGLDSFLGAVIGGPIIGLATTFGGGYLTPLTWPGVTEVVPFIIIIIVMFLKPSGLFGETWIERI
jgi:branched-chain amino acid transport system permease protein